MPALSEFSEKGHMYFPSTYLVGDPYRRETEKASPPLTVLADTIKADGMYNLFKKSLIVIALGMVIGIMYIGIKHDILIVMSSIVTAIGCIILMISILGDIDNVDSMEGNYYKDH